MPFIFSYPNTPYVKPTGIEIDISRVIVSGTEPSPITYTITPALPFGLIINPLNGTITGTPSFSSISNNILYTVDASYNTAVQNAQFTMSINYIPEFRYPYMNNLLQVNVACNLVPLYIIGNTIYSTYTLISPASLPSGLVLNSTNGIISGIPDISSNFVTYIIQANNIGIIYDASLNISVQTLPSVSYPQTTYILTQAIPIVIAPLNAIAQTNVVYSVTGCILPRGISFDTTTGIFSGTPTLLNTFRQYTVTVTNTIGSTSTTIILTVVKEFLAPPVTSASFDSGLCLMNPAIAMRRKAEILKYKQNSAGLTKIQIWSQVIKGNGPYANRTWANQNTLGSNPNTSGLVKQGNTLICASNPIKCAPISASDVPAGSITELCYDPSVPLVGYVEPIRTKTNIGFKWPQRTWTIGDMGFPVGKAGSG